MKKRIFYDTEFIEGTQKKLFGRTKPTIDLISIGMVKKVEGEDDKEYYAISKDFNLKEAWNRCEVTKDGHPVYWIRDNVLMSIYQKYVHGNMKNNFIFTYNNMKHIIKSIGKTNKTIAHEIRHFIAGYAQETNKEEWILGYNSKDIELYGYYSAYDHVVFCWLFGNMIDLPNGYPMYTCDLKQMTDELYEQRKEAYKKEFKGISGFLNELKNHPNYPRQSNEHDALEDARWNVRLYEFLQKHKGDVSFKTWE